MPQFSLRVAATVASVLCFSGVPAAVIAQTRTPVTVHQTIRVPGAVLTPGQYEFSLADQNTTIEIRSTASGRVVFLPVIAATRPSRGGILAVNPSVAGAVAELASWYPDGGKAGYEFVSDGSAPDTLSARNRAAVEAQLAAAEKAVAEAHTALNAAESHRDVIRAERGQGR